MGDKTGDTRTDSQDLLTLIPGCWCLSSLEPPPGPALGTWGCLSLGFYRGSSGEDSGQGVGPRRWSGRAAEDTRSRIQEKLQPRVTYGASWADSEGCVCPETVPQWHGYLSALCSSTGLACPGCGPLALPWPQRALHCDTEATGKLVCW